MNSALPISFLFIFVMLLLAAKFAEGTTQGNRLLAAMKNRVKNHGFFGQVLQGLNGMVSPNGMGSPVYGGTPPAGYPSAYGGIPPAYPPQTFDQQPMPPAPIVAATEAPPAENKEQEVPPSPTEEEEEPLESVSPDTAVALKQMIASQQNDLMNLQNQITSLLEELQEERQRAENEHLLAASGGQKNKLQMNIEFPSKEKVAENGANNEAEGGESKSGKTKTSNEKEEAALAVTKPIPVLSIKPDAMEDVEDAAKNVLKQEQAETAIEEKEGATPENLELKTPEERMNEALEKIDTLEAQKANMLTSQRIAEGKVGHHGFFG